MAIDSGVRAHQAWIEVGGQRFLVEQGNASLAATRESSTFSATVPMSLDGALDTFAGGDQLDAKIIVKSGSGEKTLISGELDGAEFDFITRIVVVHGRCKSAKLHQKNSSEKWLNKKPGEIIEDLAKKAGLQADVMSGQLKAGRKWADDFVKLSDTVSYAAVINKMAEFMGARWWVDSDGKLIVKDKNDSGGAYTIYYRDPMNSPIQSDALHLSISKNYQAAKEIKVTVKSWNQKEKKAYTGEKKVPLPPRRPSSFGGGGSGGGSDPLEYEYLIPGLDQDHADEYAESKANEHARHELQVSATCVGDPSCVAGMRLQLIGTPFEQSFDIDAVHHIFGVNGYTMQISAKSASEGREAQ